MKIVEKQYCNQSLGTWKIYVSLHNSTVLPDFLYILQKGEKVGMLFQDSIN